MIEPPCLTRRRFLSLAATAGAGVLAGCTVAPGTRGWAATSWAESVWKSLLEAGPLVRAPAKEYPLSAISADFPERSLNLADDYFETLGDWALEIDGLIDRPDTLTLADLQRAFPKIGHVTRHDCVEGWSAIAQFGGVRVADLLDRVKPHPEARYIVFHAADFSDDEVEYYGSLDLRQARHPQAILAFEMNNRPLTVRHGAPLRLKIPNQLGYKNTKFIYKVSLVATLADLGEGRGGYWEDAGYEHFGGI